MKQPGLISHAFGNTFGQPTAGYFPFSSSQVSIESVIRGPERIEARIRVFKSAVYEVAVYNEAKDFFQKRYFQLKEGLVNLVLPLYRLRKGKYAISIGRFEDAAIYDSGG